jgi:uncharacterized protein
VIRVVVDTSVLVSAFIGHAEAAPSQVVSAWREGRFTLVVSPRLLDELAEVVARPKFQRWADQGRGSAYASAFAARAELHADPPSSPATRDPKDDYLVALARSSGADMLVSVDLDLLTADVIDVELVRPAKLLDRLGG